MFGPGDEIAVRFSALPPPAEGMERTFFLYSDGFLKDADLNTLTGDRVGPMPRHGQTAYPPIGAGPPEHRRFVDDFLTRIVEGNAPPSRPDHSR